MTEIPGSIRRYFAKYIDRFLMGIFFVPLFFVNRTLEVDGVGAFMVAYFVAGVLVYFIFSVVWLYLFDASIGKQILGLKVRSVNDQNGLTWTQSIVRSFVDLVNILLADLMVISMFLRYDRRHLMDWLAETEVYSTVRKRKQPPQRRPFVFVFLLICYLVNLFAQTRLIIEFAKFNFGIQI